MDEAELEYLDTVSQLRAAALAGPGALKEGKGSPLGGQQGQPSRISLDSHAVKITPTDFF